MCEWTPDSIKALLDRNDLAVERAVVAVFNRQTDDEQEAFETKHRNGRGFASCHAHMGSYYAKWVLSGRRLDGRHLDRARRMMRHYAGQLAEVVAAQQPEHAMSA
jgi:hypothetical protein